MNEAEIWRALDPAGEASHDAALAGLRDLLRAVDIVFRVYGPGCECSRVAACLAGDTRDAIERGCFDDAFGKWLAGHLGIDTRWRSAPPVTGRGNRAA